MKKIERRAFVCLALALLLAAGLGFFLVKYFLDGGSWASSAFNRHLYNSSGQLASGTVLDRDGDVLSEVVDGRRKAELLRLLCQFEEINIAQSVAVGDGANDLPMLNLAGLGIAFHAKPKVKATARQSISTIGLDGILYFLGLKDSRIE